MNEYSYNGPVMEFERCICDNWKASTFAVSEKKARSNLTYRYKKENGKTANARITLPGKLTVIKREETN